MSINIATLSVLKTFYDQPNTDSIETFANLVIRLIDGKSKSLNSIKMDFESEFNLEIPIDALKTVVRRLKKNKLTNYEQITDYDIKSISISESGKKYKAQLNNTFADTTRTENKVLKKIKDFLDLKDDPEVIKNILQEFIKKNSFELTNTLQGKKTGGSNNLITNETNEGLKDFFVQSENSDQTSFDYLKSILFGQIIADNLLKEPAQEKNYQNLTIYIDANIFFSLIDLHDEQTNKCVKDTIKLIHQVGAKLAIFEHTKNEIVHVLQRYIRQQNYYYNHIPVHSIYYTLKYKGYDTNRIKYLIENIDSEFQTHGISIRFNTNNDKEINYDYFSAFRQEKNHKNNNDFSVENDCRSVTLIQQLRKNKCSWNIGKSKCLFITSDNILTRFSQDNHKNKQTIPEVFHHEQLTAQFWLTNVNSSSDSYVHNFLSKDVMSKVIDSDLWDNFIHKLEDSIRFQEINEGDAHALMADQNTQSILLNEPDPIPKIINQKNIIEIRTKQTNQNHENYELKKKLKISQEREQEVIDKYNNSIQKIERDAKVTIDEKLKKRKFRKRVLFFGLGALLTLGSHELLRYFPINDYDLGLIQKLVFLPWSLYLIKEFRAIGDNLIDSKRDTLITDLIKEKKSELGIQDI